MSLLSLSGRRDASVRRRSALARASLLVATIAGFALGAARGEAGEVTWWVTEPAKDDATKIVAEFEKANPDVKIRLQTNPYGGLQNKILIALRSGIPPDLIEAQTAWIVPYAATGKLQDITDVVTARFARSDFVPASIDSSTAGGKIYGLPFQAEALAMFYRKDLFRAAGLDPEKPPLTWPDFIEAARKLTRTLPDGKRSFGYGIAGGGPEGQGNSLFRSLPYMWMNGGGIISDDAKRAIINTPESVAGVRFYTDMFTSLKVSPPSTPENDGVQLRRLFMSGTIAMYQGTPTEIERLDKDSPGIDYGIAMMPAPVGKQTAAILGGWAFILPADAKNKTDARRLLTFLADRDRIAGYTRTFPALRAAMADARFADPRLTAFKQMLDFARPQPTLDSWLEITAVYYRHLQEVLIGGATAQQAMDAAAKEIDRILAR